MLYEEEDVTPLMGGLGLLMCAYKEVRLSSLVSAIFAFGLLSVGLELSTLHCRRMSEAQM
jgi:hypothetical protein